MSCAQKPLLLGYNAYNDKKNGLKDQSPIIHVLLLSDS